MTGRAYLDHAATTPMVPAARAAWLDQSEQLGNPSSLHVSGRRARRVVEEARESVAANLGVRPSAVVFTGSGTEADNLAVKGLFWAVRARTGADRMLVSAIEHHAVCDPAQWLADEQGARLVSLPVDAVGRVDLDVLAHELTGATAALCSVMWANNEVGTVQPVHEIAALCRTAGVVFHTDAVQALGHVPIDLAGIDAATVSGHKVGGPVGVGALVVDPRLDVTAVLHGGGQEREIRSGTLDAAAIRAFAVAVEHAVTGLAVRSERLLALRRELVRGIAQTVPDAVLNGDPGERPDQRLPGNVHVSFPGCEGDLLLMLLDAAGVDCSTGSACTSGIPEPSHVLLAMGASLPAARSSLRFTFGETSTMADVETVLAALPAAVDRARRAGTVSLRTV